MAKLLKDLYNKTYLHVVIREIKNVYDDFNLEAFESAVFDKDFKDKELKQRMRHISTCIGVFLPMSYEKSIDILKQVFPKISTKYNMENFIFQDFVEVYGLEDFKTSMSALEVFTEDSSSEFAIRQFILKYPQETMKQMKKWTSSNSLHVRRLASEGCRSRLPWAIALKEFKTNPDEVIKILELLKNDESAYVRKSVANSLNDISKDNPSIAKKLARKWLHVDKVRDDLVKHACRTLLKSGDKEVLELFGFTKPVSLHVENFECSNEVKVGEYLEFSFLINSQKNLGKLRLEYKLYFLRLNGTYGKKVFKISELSSTCREKKITKKHSFKTISTRKYYAGVQKIEIIINGVNYCDSEFRLN